MSATSDAPEAVERCLDAVDRFEPLVHAWAHLDRDGARSHARATGRDAPLRGTVVGVKDIFDTADLPTEYGSPIYAGHRPRADAGVVAQLRAAGAVVLGKTVTTEFALFEPGPTANPHRAAHTPGGSSSGSAAAIATGMADVALGTQTAGSVIRPASFCGVFGYKPTFGTVTTAGVKPIAQSLDTVGWFARDVETLDRFRVVITGRRAMSRVASPPRIALVRTEQWLDADIDARDAVEQAAHIAAGAGATVVEVELPAVLDGLAAQQTLVMTYEAARSLALEWHERRDELSSSLVRILEQGLAVDPDDYDAVVSRAVDGRVACNDDLFADVDVVLTLAAAGEAPATREHTGDPRYARLWTLLGIPSVAVPGMVGGTGLPIGVQLVGRRGDDARLLACAAWLADVLPTLPAPRP